MELFFPFRNIFEILDLGKFHIWIPKFQIVVDINSILFFKNIFVSIIHLSTIF